MVSAEIGLKCLNAKWLASVIKVSLFLGWLVILISMVGVGEFKLYIILQQIHYNRISVKVEDVNL